MKMMGIWEVDGLISVMRWSMDQCLSQLWIMNRFTFSNADAASLGYCPFHAIVIGIDAISGSVIGSVHDPHLTQTLYPCIHH